MKRKLIAGAAALLLGSLTAAADEGMWMVHAISRALEADMQARGCRLSAGEIYNADAPGAALCDAVVSLDFACTGSIISDEGLLITNHHCAFADIHALSSNEHNYLEEGFWAMLREQEMPVPGKNALFLRKVIDVTEEYEEPKPAYTTIATFMKILEKKGYLLAKKLSGRTYTYFPLISKNEYSRRAIQEVKKDLFDGSAKSLLSFFVQNEGLSADDIKELLQLIKE